MQIYELTQPKKIDEGVMDTLKTAATSAGSAIKSAGSSIKSAASAAADSKWLNTAAMVNSPQSAQKQSSMLASQVSQVATNLQKQWDVERGLMQSKAAQQSQQLDMAKAFQDWYVLNVVPPNLRANAAAYFLKPTSPLNQEIKTALAEIAAAEKLPEQGRKSEEAQAFPKLVKATMTLTQEILQRDPTLKQKPGQKTKKQQKAAASTVQAAQGALMRASNNTLRPETIAAIQQVVGTLPAVTTQDPTTRNYLKALGFNA